MDPLPAEQCLVQSAALAVQVFLYSHSTALSYTDEHANHGNRTARKEAGWPRPPAAGRWLGSRPATSEPGSAVYDKVGESILQPLRLSAVSEAEPAVLIPIDSLMPADSPRMAGENKTHIRLLAEADSTLPPILVHRETRAVIDGAHRIKAALLTGKREISAQFFDGDLNEAFVTAVRANNAHGLPLTLADRKAATERIIASNPQWSDRWIAEVVALAPNTVAKIRRSVTAQDAQSNARIGRDGRVRPLSTAQARQLAGQVIADQPAASLRHIARYSGVSIATARDVRERLRRGEDPVPRGHRPARQPTAVQCGPTESGRHEGEVQSTALQQLRRDPSLRFTDSGRSLLRWLSRDSTVISEWRKLEDRLPPHCLPTIAKVAQYYADRWAELADTLRRKAVTVEQSQVPVTLGAETAYRVRSVR